ncbi:MAG: polymer-forming cytoskeletal protein [Desulfovibrionaceae bacterium]|nr:polymer-forming cytoskeletal protein [Desulfovibrionaceae bacterium]
MARDEINAFLGAGTNYHGKLHFQGAVRIDGNFQGEVVSEGTLVIGQEAVVDGQVKVGQLVLSGKIKGEVEAKTKVVLHKTANLQGNIRTPVLVVEEGAVLEGELVMGGAGSVPEPKPKKDSPQS